MSARVKIFRFEIQDTLTVLDCASCGVVFAITDDLEQRRRADGKQFYCPNGHTNVFKESDVARLQRQLETAKRDGRFYEQRWQDEKRSKAAIKGQLTKTKKRVSNGVCPCCNRHFVDLERHMNGQHPEYGKAGE